MEQVKQAPDGVIVGRSTMLAIYDSKLDVNSVFESFKGAGYPLEDVSVYYRLKGGDQVIDAATGQVAAGQSLAQTELTPKMLENMDTLVLLHPDTSQAQAVQRILGSLGTADIKYESDSVAEGQLDPDIDAKVAGGTLPG
ncbi:MAG TPA: hypothetical protein VM409_03840 [Chloroflexia bacterium]|nr:hypothetical protein [Chloroflexia bacterium]